MAEPLGIAAACLFKEWIPFYILCFVIYHKTSNKCPWHPVHLLDHQPRSQAFVQDLAFIRTLALCPHHLLQLYCRV